jgi:hypothetical protein
VTHYKAPGAAWAQYVILVVYADYGPGGAPASMQAGNRVSPTM